MIEERKGNIAGLLALLLWSSTALFIALSRQIPPFFLTAITLFIGFFVFCTVWTVKGNVKTIIKRLHFPWYIIMLAVIGVCGYRILYFVSMFYVPAVEASLINYLWPALIVVFSTLLPNEKVHWNHFFALLLGFGGVAILLSDDFTFLLDFDLGHALALLAALVWSSYSVISRTTKQHSSDVVPLSFLIGGVILLAFSYHYESWDFDIIFDNSLLILALGFVSCVGYFLWDIGMKHGNIQMLGLGSFFVPLLSTFWLIVFGQAELTMSVLWATFLIFMSSVVASKDKVAKSILAMVRKKV